MLVVSYNPGYQNLLKALKPSTRQRFVALTFAYPEAGVEQAIVRSESGVRDDVAAGLVRLAQALRRVTDHDLEETASTRLLVMAARLIAAGLPRAFFQENIESDVADVFADAVARLKKAGVQFVEADVPGLPQLADIYMVLGHYERPRDLAIYLASHGAKRTILDVYDAAVSPAMRSTRPRLMEGEKTSSAEYRRIIEVEHPKLREVYAAYFETHRVTAMFTPASPVVAKPLQPDETVLLNGKAEGNLAYARYTLPPTTAQLPGLSVPLALTHSGMPMGGLFIGPSMSDGALLGLGPALGNVFPALPPPKLDV